MHACQVDKRKAVRLYYGTKNESYTAFKHLIPLWQDEGITVKHVYSDDKGGYVQQIFREVRTAWHHPLHEVHCLCLLCICSMPIVQQLQSSPAF